MEVLASYARLQMFDDTDVAAAAIHQDFPFNPHNILGENSYPWKRSNLR